MVQYEEGVPCSDTVPNIDWCLDHDLDLQSHPADWFAAFLPIKNGRHGNKKIHNEECTIMEKHEGNDVKWRFGRCV